MEVQSHGNDYEDLVIKRLTGLSKKEYDALTYDYSFGEPIGVLSYMTD